MPPAPSLPPTTRSPFNCYWTATSKQLEPGSPNSSPRCSTANHQPKQAAHLHRRGDARLRDVGPPTTLAQPPCSRDYCWCRVGIWSPNTPEWTLLQYATAQIGAMLVTIT